MAEAGLEWPRNVRACGKVLEGTVQEALPTTPIVSRNYTNPLDEYPYTRYIIKKGKGLFGKFFGKSLVLIEAEQLGGTVSIYDPSLREPVQKKLADLGNLFGIRLALREEPLPESL